MANQSHADSYHIRQAQPSDIPALTALLNQAFQKDMGTTVALFLQAKWATSHSIACTSDDVIVACVGHYAYTLHSDNRTIAAVGIGQVATDPQHRGQGLMRRLMTTALNSHPEAELWWLWGLRPRYRHFGFDLGGSIWHGHIFNKSLPVTTQSPPVETPLPQLLPQIMQWLSRNRWSCDMSADDVLLLLNGLGIQAITYETSWLLWSPQRQHVLAWFGISDEIGQLLAHISTEERSVTCVCDPFDMEARSLIHAFIGHESLQPMAMMRGTQEPARFANSTCPWTNVYASFYMSALMFTAALSVNISVTITFDQKLLFLLSTIQ